MIETSIFLSPTGYKFERLYYDDKGLTMRVVINQKTKEREIIYERK